MFAALRAVATALPRVVRAREWWSSKLAPLLGVAYLLVSVLSVTPARAYATIAALLAGLACLSAFGYVVSDVFDVAPDHALGKPNVLAPLSAFARVLLLGSLAVAGILPWLVVPVGVPAGWTWAGIYVLLAAYSAPRLRLKQRGLGGVLADAAMAHALPTLFVYLVFAEIQGANAVSPVFASALVTWALCLGVRNALIGQLWDYSNDVRTGTASFTVSVGPERAIKLGRRIAFPGELLALGALAVAAAAAPWLPWLLTLALVHELRRIGGRAPRRDPVPANPGQAAASLHDLYEVWLPITASVALTVRDWRFGLLPVCHFALFHESVRNRLLRPLLARVRSLALPGRPAGTRPHGLPSPPICYVICATPRSGSYLLCETLWRTGLLGRPSEYFLPWLAIDRNLRQWDPSYIDAWRLPAQAFIQRVIQEGSTPNGVFGVKVMWSYLDVVLNRLRGLPFLADLRDAGVLTGLWPNLRYIFITRRDKVRQAVSLAKALQSSKWVDLDLTVRSPVALDLARGVGGVGAMRNDDGQASGAPRYDAGQLWTLYRERQNEEEAWARFFRASGITPFTVHYEDLVKADHQTAIDVAGYLGVSGVEGITFPPTVLRRQADPVNDDWSRRFSEELARRG